MVCMMLLNNEGWVSASNPFITPASLVNAINIIPKANNLPIRYFKNVSFELSRNNEMPESKNSKAVKGFFGENDGKILLNRTILNIQPESIMQEIKMIRIFNMPNVLLTFIKTSFPMY